MMRREGVYGEEYIEPVVKDQCIEKDSGGMMKDDDWEETLEACVDALQEKLRSIENYLIGARLSAVEMDNKPLLSVCDGLLERYFGAKSSSTSEQTPQ